MNSHRADLESQIAVAFAGELATRPEITLRGACEIDVGRTPPPFDPELDSPSVAYLERHGYDLPFLDAESWRNYLPRLLALAVANVESPSNAVDGLLASLRPPDRTPRRLASLSAKQEASVVAVLEVLAFNEGSVHVEGACAALEEWWGETPIYRYGQNVA
jgi:hypothetical protein